MRRQDIDRERQMIYVAETLTRYGTTMEGLKQTHHIPRARSADGGCSSPPS